jgi:hypothetical protein
VVGIGVVDGKLITALAGTPGRDPGAMGL